MSWADIIFVQCTISLLERRSSVDKTLNGFLSVMKIKSSLAISFLLLQGTMKIGEILSLEAPGNNNNNNKSKPNQTLKNYLAETRKKRLLLKNLETLESAQMFDFLSLNQNLMSVYKYLTSHSEQCICLHLYLFFLSKIIFRESDEFAKVQNCNDTQKWCKSWTIFLLAKNFGLIKNNFLTVIVLE